MVGDTGNTHICRHEVTVLSLVGESVGMVHKRFSRRDWFMGATLMALTGCAENSSEGPRAARPARSPGRRPPRMGRRPAEGRLPCRRPPRPRPPMSTTGNRCASTGPSPTWNPSTAPSSICSSTRSSPFPPRGVRQRGGAGLRRLVHHQVGGRRPARRAARPSLRPRVAGRLLRASRSRRGAQPRAARASRSQAPRPVDRRPQLQPFPPGQGVHGPDHHRLDRAPVEYRQGPVDRQTVQRTHELHRRTARRVPACPS